MDPSAAPAADVPNVKRILFNGHVFTLLDEDPAPPTPALTGPTNVTNLLALYHQLCPTDRVVAYREICRRQEAQRQRKVREALAAMDQARLE
jgi:hypothetical protein